MRYAAQSTDIMCSAWRARRREAERERERVNAERVESMCRMMCLHARC